MEQHRDELLLRLQLVCPRGVSDAVKGLPSGQLRVYIDTVMAGHDDKTGLIAAKSGFDFETLRLLLGHPTASTGETR